MTRTRIKEVTHSDCTYFVAQFKEWFSPWLPCAPSTFSRRSTLEAAQKDVDEFLYMPKVTHHKYP